MTQHLAQSAPSSGKSIQRTIEVEEDVKPQQTRTEAKADNTVFLGLMAVMLVVIAIGAATLMWSKYPIGGAQKSAGKNPQKPDLL